VLTVIATIVLPLTFIASIFGMNVEVPGEGSMAAFWILVGAMVGLGVAMFGYFRWKRWL
jgi:magnesium transporter